MSNTSGNNSGRYQFQVALTCPGCRQAGYAVWEEDSAVTTRGPQSYLVSLSPGFHERMGQANPFVLELVCQRCGTVQPN